MSTTPSTPAPPTAAAAKITTDAHSFWSQKSQTNKTSPPRGNASSGNAQSFATPADTTTTTTQSAQFPTPWLRLSAKKAPGPINMKAANDFERIVAARDQRIKQLEAEVLQKQSKIAELTTEMEGYSVHIERMLLEADNQTSKYEALIKRITHLESQLEKKLGGVEGSVTDSDSSTQVCEEQDAGRANKDTVDPITGLEKDTGSASTGQQQDSQESTAPSSTKSTDDATNESSSTSTGNPIPKVSPTKDAKGPAFVDRDFPLMWSPDAPKAKPVEKPKVLKMAVDMSKYGKKTATKVASPIKDDQVYIFTVNASHKRDIKAGQVPEIDPHLDIRQMSYEKRVQFAAGPRVDVFMGKTKLAILPQYVLSQCSRKAHEHFKKTPTATSINFPEGSMDITAAISHLTWMGEMTYQHRVYSVNVRHGTEHDERNIKVCEAARVMGLTAVYVGHFTKMFCDRVRSGKATTEFLTMVCDRAVPGNDPVFDCLANCLAMQPNKINVPKEGVEMLAENFPALKKKMEHVQRLQKSSRK